MGPTFVSFIARPCIKTIRAQSITVITIEWVPRLNRGIRKTTSVRSGTAQSMFRLFTIGIAS